MSKIISAANAMVANPEKISSVIAGSQGDEIFFIYGGKYKWSIKSSNGAYYLYFYPGNQSIEEIASIYDWQENIPMIAYTTKELKTQEAEQTFKALFSLVKEKIYGVDNALDEIINDLF